MNELTLLADLPPLIDWFNHALDGRITTVRRNELTLVISIECEHPIKHDWLHCSIECSGVAEAQVTPDALEEISAVTEHPLLLSYYEPQFFLHFNTAPSSAEAVIGRLYLAHHAILADWRSFEHFFNPMNLQKLLQGGVGMLANGPESVMVGYRDAVADHMNVYLNSCSNPIAKSLQVLLFNDADYVVCQNYRVTVSLA